MDLSAFIFVALAIAWAVYLVPKAIKHQNDVKRSRSVDRFSHTMRVLARREPVNRRNARLVVTPGRPTSTPVVTSKRSSAAAAVTSTASTASVASVASPVSQAAGEAAPVAAPRGRSAAARRRNVLAVLLLAGLVVVGLAAFGVLGWPWTAVPSALVVAWLVTCRLMVKQERTVRAPRAADQRRATGAAPAATATVGAGAGAGASAPVAEATGTAEPAEEGALGQPDVFEDTSSMPAVQVPPIDPALWDPVPVTLPTYVTKPAATRRTVRTIDLDDSGVWTSGRTESDAALARDAHAADRAERNRRDQAADHRAVGS